MNDLWLVILTCFHSCLLYYFFSEDDAELIVSNSRLVDKFSKKFQSDEQVDKVAKLLLWDLPDGGSQNFQKQLPASGNAGSCSMTPTEKMRKLLIDWCTEKPEDCNKEKLYYQVLSTVPLRDTCSDILGKLKNILRV